MFLNCTVSSRSQLLSGARQQRMACRLHWFLYRCHCPHSQCLVEQNRGIHLLKSLELCLQGTNHPPLSQGHMVRPWWTHIETPHPENLDSVPAMGPVRRHCSWAGSTHACGSSRLPMYLVSEPTPRSNSTRDYDPSPLMESGLPVGPCNFPTQRSECQQSRCKTHTGTSSRGKNSKVGGFRTLTHCTCRNASRGV